MIEIIDNAIPQEDYQKLHDTLFGIHFPWYYANGINLIPDDYYQFIHSFYYNHRPQSTYADLLDPILLRLDLVAIIRIKGNLTPNTPTIIEHGMHLDITNDPYAKNPKSAFPGKTAVYTTFENGQKIESIANRLVTFDSNLKHSGSSCTNQKMRCVININYVPRIW
jgi:hypothetical protein